MILLVWRLLLAYIDTTATHSPASEWVDRRINDTVLTARVCGIAVCQVCFDGLGVASCDLTASCAASCVIDGFWLLLWRIDGATSAP
ncbi:hypothetical protein TNCV_4150301 [Trichonephila clavipes]|uniref:Secreted protein n=1 Tax=Trichonephila clavipes TaxID=2585209 RepID=A0A8X6W5L7_TRICX|nr:hypothetical protein TNCV_4150301 [Trichonephila clavipes]